MSTGVRDVSLDQSFAFDRKLDGEFSSAPVLGTGDFALYGDLARNTKLLEGMGISEADLQEIVGGKTEHYSMAVEMMAKSLRGEDGYEDLKELYNRDELALAADLYRADKLKAKQANIDRVVALAANTTKGKKIKGRVGGSELRFSGLAPAALAPARDLSES